MRKKTTDTENKRRENTIIISNYDYNQLSLKGLEMLDQNGIQNTTFLESCWIWLNAQKL